MIKTNNPNFKLLFGGAPIVTKKEFMVWLGKNCHNKVRWKVIVAKKDFKLAVVRNKIKRTVKEIFKEFKQKFINKDVIILVKKRINPEDFSQWKEQMRSVFVWLEKL